MSATKLLRRVSGAQKDAISLLKKDHDNVKKLFDQFEKAEEKEDTARAKKLAEQAITELKVHATVEEELFYPALRREMEDEDGLLDEADEEHHAAKLLIAELDLMSGEEENFCAKFTVLAENVRHHIKEEEGDLFKQAKRTDIDFEALGERMQDRKQELMSSGVPEGVEAEMIRKAGLPPESPAKRAVSSVVVPMTEKTSRRRHSRRPLRALMFALLAGAAASAAAQTGGGGTGSGAATGSTGSTGSAQTPNQSPTLGQGTGRQNSGQIGLPSQPGNPGMQPGSPIGGPATPPSAQIGGGVGGVQGTAATGAGVPGGAGSLGGTGVIGGTGVSGTAGTGTGISGTAGAALPGAAGTAPGTIGQGAGGLVNDDPNSLESRVRQSIMQGAPATGGVTGLGVTTNAQGRLVLTGTVGSQAERDNIQAKAAAFVGFQNVENNINVR